MNEGSPILGISMSYLQGASFVPAAEAFLALQSEYGLGACEVHMEGIQFAAGYCRPMPAETAALSMIRSRVDVLGFHLPYLDLNPISADPDIAGFAMERLCQAIGRAADAQAEYVVFHVRGRGSPYSQRRSDMEGWLGAVKQLSEYAEKRNLAFCLENADDLRTVEELCDLAAKSMSTKICLDIGHLFERLELQSSLERAAARLWDRFLPWSSISGKGIPFFEAGGMQGCRNLIGDRLYCLHVHNHNGRLAHQPLTEGKIDVRSLLRQSSSGGIPVILEADYRLLETDTVRTDLRLLKGWIS